MEASVHDRAGACAWVGPTGATSPSPPEPFQLSFLSPFVVATGGQGEHLHEDAPKYINVTRRLRRRRCRSLTEVPPANSTTGE